MIYTDLIVWRDSFNIGYEKIDIQHKQLVKLINELYRIHILEDKDQKMTQIFLDLQSYTVSHFSQEELLMKKYNYKFFSEHKSEHNEFLEKIEIFKTKY